VAVANNTGVYVNDMNVSFQVSTGATSKSLYAARDASPYLPSPTAGTIGNNRCNIIFDFCYPVVTATNLTPTFGTLDPTGEIAYAVGSTPTYTFTPNTGYHVKEVKYNGTVVLTGNPFVTEVLTYTLPAITNADATLTVEFAPNNYYLTLDPNSGTVTPTQLTVTFTQAIGTLPEPTRPDYYFMGWYIGTTLITETTLYSWPSNQTAVAKWNPIYTLSFNPNGGSVSPTSKQVVYDLPIGELPTPTLAGYDFSGWYIGTTLIGENTTWTYTSNQWATA